VFGVSSSSKSRGTSAARGLLGSIVSISSSSSSTISSSGDSASDAAGSSQPPGDDAAATSAAREGGTADGSSSSSSAESKRATQRSSRTVSSSSKKQPVLASTFLPAKLQDGIDILKVDVEGREPDVFATAGRLLASGKVQNIIMEYSPGYYYQVTDRL
jgi:hypothetical protein